MENQNYELFMGDYTISVSTTKQGTKVAKLSHATEFAVAEIEKVDEKIRLKEMNIGSAYITPEHLALMLHHTGLSEEIMHELEKIKNINV